MRGDIPAQDTGRASGPHCGAGGCGERPVTWHRRSAREETVLFHWHGLPRLKELMGRSGCSTGAPWWAWSWVSFMCCRSSTLYISLSTYDLCRAGWAPQVSMSMIVTMLALLYSFKNLAEQHEREYVDMEDLRQEQQSSLHLHLSGTVSSWLPAPSTSCCPWTLTSQLTSPHLSWRYLSRMLSGGLSWRMILYIWHLRYNLIGVLFVYIRIFNVKLEHLKKFGD